MLLAYQGLPRIYNPSVGGSSNWKAYYAVVTSSDQGATSYTQSCQTVYQDFRLVDCDGVPLDRFGPDNPNCDNCLRPADYTDIGFCDANGGPCLVGIVNRGDVNGNYKQNCYIEVFFVGAFEEQDVPPGSGVIYAKGTILASLRWSATAQFMIQNNGAMLNCTNHTLP